MKLKTKRRAIGVFFACATAAWAASQGGFSAQGQRVAAGNPHDFELRPDHAQVVAGDSTQVDVLANDSSPGDTLVLMAVSQPQLGSVELIDGVPVYTAPAGAQGSTTFEYIAKPRHGGPPRQAQVSVDIGSRISIRGTVVRAPDQTGPVSVELHVGSQTQSTIAAEDGRYALDFIAFDDAPVALLEARGAAGSHPALHLQSYLGSVGRIKRLAGSDGVLERRESNAVTISFLSTAQLIHATAANGGLPTSDAAFEAALLGTEQTSILWAADFLQLVDSGEYSLPADTDVLAYVSAPGNIVRNWSSDAGLDYPDPALDQRQVVLTSPEAYNGRQVLLTYAVEHATLDGIRDVEIHDFDASGHHFVDGYARPASALQPGYDDEGRATFTPEANFILRERDVRVGRSGTTHQLRYLLERKWVKLFDGDRGDQLFQQDTIALVHPNRPDLDRTTYQYTMWVAYDQLPVVPYASDEVAGRMMLGVYCPRGNLVSGFGYCDYQTHAFNTNGTGGIESMGPALDGAGHPVTQSVGDSFLWAVTRDGALSIRRGDIETRFTRINQENSAASGVIAESSVLVDGGVKRIAHYQESLRLPAQAPAITTADLTGLWEPGVIHLGPLDLLSMPVWTFEFNASGNGSEKVNDASLFNNEYRFAWSADTDAVTLRKYPVSYYDGGQFVLSDGYCSSGDGQCPIKVQRWKPVAAADGTYYFVEEVYDSSRFPSVPLARSSIAPLSLHRN